MSSQKPSASGTSRSSRPTRSALGDLVSEVLEVLAEDAPLVDPGSGGIAILLGDPLDRLADDVLIAAEVRVRPDAALFQHRMPVFYVLGVLGVLGKAGRDSP